MPNKNNERSDNKSLEWVISPRGFILQANGRSCIIKVEDLDSLDIKATALELGVEPKDVFRAKCEIHSFINGFRPSLPVPEEVKGFWNELSFEERLEAIAHMDPQINMLWEEGVRRGWISEVDDAKKLSVGQRAEILTGIILSRFRFVKVNFSGKSTGKYELYALDGNMLRDAENVIDTCVNSMAGYLASKNLISEVESRVMSKARHISSDKINPPEYLPVKNGIISLRYFEFVPQCDYYFTYRVPIEVDPEFLRMLREGKITEDYFSNSVVYKVRRHYDQENWEYLLDVLGSILAPIPLRLMAFIVGPQATGKTLLAEAVKACLGQGIASPSLKDLQQDPFALQSAIGARAIITSETVYAIKEVEVLKRLVGGDTLSINRKHKPRIELSNNTLKIICFSNKLPPIDIKDDALLDRISIVQAEDPIPEEERDSTLLAKVKSKEERWKTFEFLLYCAWELKQRDYRLRRLDQENILKLVDEASNPIAWFFEYVAEDLEVRTKRTVMWSYYVEICRKREVEPVSRNKFYVLMGRRYPVVKVRGEYYFKGVRPKTSAELELGDNS